MTRYIRTLLKDKCHNYSLRELVIAISMLLVIASWVAQLAFDIHTPEYMFYSVVSLIASGCFGYSIERRITNQNQNQTDEEVRNESDKK